jgi:hypothetical protein
MVTIASGEVGVGKSNPAKRRLSQHIARPTTTKSKTSSVSPVAAKGESKSPSPHRMCGEHHFFRVPIRSRVISHPAVPAPGWRLSQKLRGITESSSALPEASRTEFKKSL